MPESKLSRVGTQKTDAINDSPEGLQMQDIDDSEMEDEWVSQFKSNFNPR